MGRHKIVREFPLTPKYVKWQDGRERDEIEAILRQLSGHMPEACRGQLCKGILWAVRQLQSCYDTISKDEMDAAEYAEFIKRRQSSEMACEELEIDHELLIQMMMATPPKPQSRIIIKPVEHE